MPPEPLALSPLSGTLLLLVAVICGRNFRQNWKAQGPRWVLWAWLYGAAAAAALLALAFVPLEY
ncbi:hypothetical protein [Tropicimonas sp.]|uniref:hypothetical protein n=1 Tax=Tropicimonas sp. TaxID=2067044 RepID=UPI003A891BDA